MQINAISSANYTTNFTGKKHNSVKNAAKNAAVATMFLVPIAATNTSCNDHLNVSAHAGVTVPFCPGDTIRDTVYVPPVFEYPDRIMDSLNYYRGDILDITANGDDGDYTNKALLYAKGNRNWDYNRPEYIKLNLAKSNNDEARYDHVIIRNNNDPDDLEDITNDIRITLVNKGDIKVVKKDGTVTDQVSGLLLNEDGVKTFIHSNGYDRIFVYPKATSGENVGRYVELGTVEPGYLPEDGGTPDTKYGQNVLLNSILSPGTEDHYINVEALVRDIDELKAEAAEQYTVED